MTDDELRTLARKRLKAQLDFRNFLWTAIGISVVLTAIWAITNPGGYFWPAWAIFGLAIALIFQGISAYGQGSRIVTESDVDAEVERLKRGKQGS